MKTTWIITIFVMLSINYGLTKIALSETASAAAVSTECASIAVPVPKTEKFQQVLF